MKPYWLSLVPLVVAAVVYMLHKQRALAVSLSLATALACAGITLALPREQTALFLGQTWALDSSTRTLLTGLFLATALLLASAATTEQADTFCAPALTSAGLLSVTLLLRSLWLACLLMPAALVVLVLTARPSSSAVQGAARFLALVTLPMPFMLAAFGLLQRLVLFPDETALAELAALLVVPITALWLTLFPFQGITIRWADDSVPLTPAFLWVAKDWAVVYLLLTVWRQNPMLHTDTAVLVLGVLGLATAAVSGVWAYLQTNPGALLACAAMSELGIVVQGVASSSPDGVRAAVWLLANRSLAILLATSALAALGGTLGAGQPGRPATRWKGWLALLAFVVSILALAGVAPLGGFATRKQVYAALQPQGSYVLITWLVAALGIVLGLVRVSWSLWHAPPHPTESRLRYVGLLLVVCLLLLYLWAGLHPQPPWNPLADLVRGIQPPAAL